MTLQTQKRGIKNITLIGGIYEFNGVTNPQTGAYLDGLFSGHGILLNGVDGLTIRNIKNAGNALKYAFLIANVTNVLVENCHVENSSDGFHFQPPCKNIHLKNLTGSTGDNFISFTIGDYTMHTVSEDGNGENILIENIHVGTPDKPTNEPIRFVGNGKSKTGYFDNIVIRNVTAYLRAGKAIINFMKGDTIEGNIYLTGTTIIKAKISNISCLNDTSQYLILAESDFRVLEIDGLNIDVGKTPKVLLVPQYIQLLSMSNFYIRGTIVNNDSMFLLGIDWHYKIKNLSISSFRIDVSSAVDFSIFNVRWAGVENFNIKDSFLNGVTNKGYLFNYDNKETTRNTNINILNCSVSGLKKQNKQ